MNKEQLKDIDGWIKYLVSEINKLKKELDNEKKEKRILENLCYEVIYTIDLMQNNLELNNSYVQMVGRRMLNVKN